ncbi:MAG: SAM-dependent methyltransferase [Spirulinaceae cyanobacterium SM2_1_0]|nr:SAM-dependent methyltransferase [Spirulinaceae cyanobacterium SM2_1_0]
MGKTSLGLDARLQTYLTSISPPEAAILQALRQETTTQPGAQMQIAVEQGQFLTLLVQLLSAERALEIGVFTGYSSLCVALALPPQGRLVACDIDPEATQIAQRYWQAAGVADKIELRLAPALDTLASLLTAGAAESFDFAFIDADKRNYQNYYERSLALVRPGGLIAIDNVLWSGKVADPAVQDTTTQAIRDFNVRLRNDARVTVSVIPIADGLTLARKH